MGNFLLIQESALYGCYTTQVSVILMRLHYRRIKGWRQIACGHIKATTDQHCKGCSALDSPQLIKQKEPINENLSQLPSD